MKMGNLGCVSTSLFNSLRGLFIPHLVGIDAMRDGRTEVVENFSVESECRRFSSDILPLVNRSGWF